MLFVERMAWWSTPYFSAIMENKTYSMKDLRKLQLVELEILKEAEGRCLHFTAHGPRAEQLIKELHDGV